MIWTTPPTACAPKRRQVAPHDLDPLDLLQQVLPRGGAEIGAREARRLSALRRKTLVCEPSGPVRRCPRWCLAQHRQSASAAHIVARQHPGAGQRVRHRLLDARR
jgi:hypothetical protein